MFLPGQKLESAFFCGREKMKVSPGQTEAAFVGINHGDDRAIRALGIPALLVGMLVAIVLPLASPTATAALVVPL
jgi:hypothetical protein